MTEVAIQIEHLTRDFSSTRALDDLSLVIPQGIVFGFLGPNGAGKTTTIRLILGLLRPTRGRIQVLGYDPAQDPESVRTRTGALLEHSGLYERLSGRDNLEFYARAWGLSANERQTRIKTLLTHFGLWDRRNETVVKWSRGMKQKLAVARTLLHRPPIVLLDEPTAGLDPVASAALRDDLANLVASEGVTVFLNTHNLTEAEKLCAEVGVIRQGKLLAVGPPETLKDNSVKPGVIIVGNGLTPQIAEKIGGMPGVVHAGMVDERLQLELDGNRPVAPIISALVGWGVGIEEVNKGKASLEQVFLSLMEDES
jgi:ABC-2 type transport system ATP-binding protein